MYLNLSTIQLSGPVGQNVLGLHQIALVQASCNKCLTHRPVKRRNTSAQLTCLGATRVNNLYDLAEIGHTNGIQKLSKSGLLQMTMIQHDCSTRAYATIRSSLQVLGRQAATLTLGYKKSGRKLPRSLSSTQLLSTSNLMVTERCIY